MLEEPGWQVQVTGLLGVYSDPASQTYTYPDGNTVQFVATVFEALALQRTETPDTESLGAGFFEPHALPSDLVRTSVPQVANACSAEPRPFYR